MNEEYRKFFKLIAILFFIICACSRPNDQAFSPSSDGSKIWLESFFKDLMLYEGGIYTLCGSKPMTIVPLHDYDEEKIKKFYLSLSESEQKKFFQLPQYSLPKTWEKWKVSYSDLPMDRFILSQLEQDGKKTLFFVDVLKTAAVIQDHYQEFSKVIDQEFHPLDVVLELKFPEKTSFFWEKVQKCSALWGLLLGYGKINSYAFHWKYFNHPESCKSFCERLSFKITRSSTNPQINYQMGQFEIPGFASFILFDETIDKYQMEREKIIKLYEGKDFVEFTLKLLKSEG